MGFTEFLLLQFLAHVLADFFFQSNSQAIEKNTYGFKSKFLVWHTLIVFALSWLLSFQLHFFIGAAVIAIIHYLIDGLKPSINKYPAIERYYFFIDQGLHLVILAAVAYFYNTLHGLDFYWEPPISNNVLFIITAYIVCIMPANVVVKEVFRSCQIDIALAKEEADINTSNTHELPNAGKIIGVLERLLTLTFILAGQYEAVGFLIAGKSVLRFKDTDTFKSEYLLIGTLLSFGIAVVLGILVSP